ncbi:putative transmembrane protein, partial [Gregarina niphandrodes]
MATALWGFMTYGILGTGMGVTGLMLSGYATLERLGFKVASNKVTFGLDHDSQKAGAVAGKGLPLPAIIITVAVVLMMSEYSSLQNLRNERLMTKSTLHANVVRHQRNWWLCLLSAVVWT